MDHNTSLSIITAFDEEAILASGVKYSIPYDVSRVGAGSLHAIVTGDGTAKIDLVVSNNGADAVEDYLASSEVEDAITVGSGMYTLTIPPVARMAIKVTETGGSDPIGITVILGLK